MRFARYVTQNSEIGFGVVENELIYRIPGIDDLSVLLNSDDNNALYDAGHVGKKQGSAVEVANVHLLSPMATPATFRDFYAFEQHVLAANTWRATKLNPMWYDVPIFYFSNPYAFMSEGPVAISPGCMEFDFELEVAAIIGKMGRNLTPNEGDDAVAGYCILNDWSARDLQFEEMKLSLGPAKGKDSATGLGPYFVTKDELADFREGSGFNLQMTCSVNGRQYSKANWSEVYWSFGEMAAYASRGTEVRPADVLGSGTCGTGCILELSATRGTQDYPWLCPGDSVVVAIECLGELRNTVVASPPVVSIRSAHVE